MKTKTLPPLDCRLDTWSDDARLQQIYTGLAILNREGKIRLHQNICSDPGAIGMKGLRAGSAHLQLTLNGTVRLFYDLTDQGSLDQDLVKRVDYYFKRSFDAAKVAQMGDIKCNILPLGLNYPVYPDRFDWLSLRRAFAFGSLRHRLTQALRVLDLGNRWSHLPRENYLNAPPNADALPQVLFLVRAWDPEEFPGCTPNRTSHYHSVNEMRAHCVRALRSEFGGKFTGGFSHTDFAKSKYPDCLAPDSKLTSKSQYLELLKRFPICVTSGGLHGSIGWKMGEYVALSKAIVTERLSYQVPSPFEEGENFLAYDTPDGCVAAVRRLMDDPGLRTSMMQKNREYFLQHLRPDVLVLRTLSEALGHHP